MPSFVVKTSDLGSSPTTLTNAEPGDPSWGLPDSSWSFRIPTLDPQATEALLGADGWEREGELWIDGTKRFAGPIISSDAGPVWTTCNCEGLLAYFGSEVRQIDKGADRVNLLTNPEFESGTTGWTATGTTFTVDSAVHIKGSQSAKLVESPYDENSYISQTVSVASSADGELLTLAAWFKVLSSGYLGPAYQNRGLWLQHDQGGVDLGVFEIDDETPKDVWIPCSVTVWIPANVTADVTVRLYSLGGTIRWDALQLVKMESLSTAHESPPGTVVWTKDEATFAGDVIDFLQTSPWSDLDITKSISTTGTDVERAFQYADHIGGREALAELTSMGRFEIGITPDRVFTTYPGGKGTDRTSGDGAVTLTLNTNCVLPEPGLRRDGYQGAGTVVSLGPGDGPAREEGSAKDATVFGGKTVQEIFTPPAMPPIDNLDASAATRLAGKKKPRVLKLRITDPAVAGTVEEGDTVNVDVPHGYASATDAWRIVRRSIPISEDKPSFLDVELNPVA